MPAPPAAKDDGGAFGSPPAKHGGLPCHSVILKRKQKQKQKETSKFPEKKKKRIIKFESNSCCVPIML